MTENKSSSASIPIIVYEIISVIAYSIGFCLYLKKIYILLNYLYFDQLSFAQPDLSLKALFHAITKHSSFKDWVLSLDPSKINSISKLTNEERSKIIDQLVQYAIIEPIIHLNDSCKPQIKLSLNCEDYPLSFNGTRYPQTPKPKIAHLIQYGFETDVLEILLSEIYDYVDKIFIAESEITHYQSIKKTLVWPLLSKQKRFQQYLDKIVYFHITSEMIEDYSKNLSNEDKFSIWKNEIIQEQLRFKLFLKWNENNNYYFRDDDIIGFGDTDEIPSFHNLILLKKCIMKGTIDIGIWFTFGQINKYFLSHHPIFNHKDTLGDPTYWYLKDAIKKGNPSRNRGKSPFFILGGIHLTHYGYLPNLILKDLSKTENEGSFLLAIVRRLLSRHATVEEISRKIFFDVESEAENYFDLPSEKLNHPPFMVPWIMQCNPLRYPSFFENYQPDHRIS